MRPSASPTRATSSRSSAQLRADGRRGGLADAGRRAVGAERLAQRARPLAGRHARAGGGDRGRHDVLVARRHAAQLLQRGRHVAARGAPALELVARLLLDRRVDHQDPAVGGQRRRLGLLVAVDADHHLLAGLDPADPLAVRLHQRRLHVRDGLDGAALLLHARHLLAGAGEQLGRPARPSPSSPRRCRGTRAGPSRRRAPAGSAATTAGPTAAAARAPRSRPGAGSRARGRCGRA